MHNCIKCGMDIPDSARVCPYCHVEIDNWVRNAAMGIGSKSRTNSEQFNLSGGLAISSALKIGGLIAFFGFISSIFVEYESIIGIPNFLIAGLIVILFHAAVSFAFNSSLLVGSNKTDSRRGLASLALQVVLPLASLLLGVYLLFKL